MRGYEVSESCAGGGGWPSGSWGSVHKKRVLTLLTLA